MVTEAGASYDWSEEAYWSWGNLDCFLDAVLFAFKLPCGLVEPGFDVTLPILVEMGVWNHIVTFWCHFLGFFDRGTSENDNTSHVYASRRDGKG